MQAVTIAVTLAYSVFAVALFARAVVAVFRTVRLGAPDHTRAGRHRTRAATMLKETIGHTRMLQWTGIGVAHWFVFVGFILLFFTLVTAYGQLFDPAFALPLLGHWVVYEWITEIIGWATLLGILALMAVRLMNLPGRLGRVSRFYGSTMWQAYFVEWVILLIALCVLTLRGLEYALAGETGWSADFPLTSWIGGLFAGAAQTTLEAAIIGVAALKIIVSMTWFVVIATHVSMGVAWHRFLVFVNVWFKRHPEGKPSLGELEPIRVGDEPIDFERIDELPEDAALGAGKVEDFTWKGWLDFSTCTECGRCQSQCPAWNTGKPLSPKLVILALRDHAYAKAPYLQAVRAAGGDGASADGQGQVPLVDFGTGDGIPEHERPLVGTADQHGVIDPDVIWSCVTCGACVQQCPVDIEHVDHIVNMRRFQVLMESSYPSELGGLFRNLENKGNPWGVNQSARLDWTKGLPFEVKVVGDQVSDLSEVEYLFWVGCAGAFEDRQKRTIRAVAELLDIAGVDFAVLGEAETCTGDPARRSGNEFLFQMLAAETAATLQEAKATKVVTTCAHCFNTLMNEYPQLGVNLEVVHHTQLLNRLVRDGRLTPVKPVSAPAGGRAGLAAAPSGTSPATASSAAQAGADAAATEAAADRGTSEAAGAAPTASGLGGAGTVAPGPGPTGGADAPVTAGGASLAPVVTYHDPCYIGRHNGVYTPPRELIAALPGVELREMPRHAERSFCCGAGGARMWMEERIGTRINATRTAEAVATGAERIAVACPYCRVMLSDGLAAAQSEGRASEDIAVVDVAQMLLDAVKREAPPALSVGA